VRAAAACAAATACTGLFLQPEPGLRWTPAAIGLAYQDVHFASDDGVALHGWLLPSPVARGPAPTIVFLHGNAENISTHLGNVAWLPAEGFQVFLFDYRGFGLSAGAADLPGALRDAEAAIRLAPSLPGVDETRVVVFGQSLGGALALAVAARLRRDVPIRALVLDSAPSDWRLVAREVLSRSRLTRALARPASRLVPVDPSPTEAVRSLGGTPLLIVHGEADEIVSPEHARRLHDATGGEAELWLVPGVPHIGAFERPIWRARLVAHLKAALDIADPPSRAAAGHTRNESVILPAPEPSRTPLPDVGSG
jgi:hypothetical protein